jgi:hypothetical protein
MWSEEEECIESLNTKHGVTSTPENPLSDACTVRNTTQSDEKNYKYDKIVDIVLKQSEQIEALTRIVSRKQTSNVYHGNNVRYDTQRSQPVHTFTQEYHRIPKNTQEYPHITQEYPQRTCEYP